MCYTMDGGYEIFDDDLEVLELIEVGIPRQLYIRIDNFHNLNNMEFFNRFRLRKHVVVAILQQIDEVLEYPYNRNYAASPINQVLIALRYYATGSHLLSIADFCGVHVSTACRIVQRVSRAIARLSPRYIQMPNTLEAQQSTKQLFFEIAAFPNIIGAIDGTHIRIQSPGGDDAEIFRNRKQYFSINVQAVVDAQMKCTNLVARWPGSAHDSTIFNNSTLKRNFENGLYNNSCLLGDSAYNLRRYLLTPLLNPIGDAEQKYNESHIRTRGVVEKFFGIWKRRFPVMVYGCRLKLNNILPVIVATGVLQNIAQNMREPEPPQMINDHHLNRLIQEGMIPDINPNNDNDYIADVRQNLITHYFGHL